MAIGVDSSKWKPRKITGTPAGKVSNKIGLGILMFGVLWGAIYQFSGATENYRKNLEILYEDPETEVERRQIIASGLLSRTGDTIRKLMEEDARPDLPDK